MRDYNHIWDQAKVFMKEDIEQLDDNANVTIVLFHHQTAEPIRFKANEFNWKNVESLCDNMLEASIRTGICNAWDSGLKYIDKKRNNYLYLFTDGTENVNRRGTDAVCERIKRWCNQAPNNYAFFVALGEQKKKSPDVMKLIDATKTCDRTFFIKDHQGPFGAFDKTTFKLNSHSTKNLMSGFSDYGTFNASVECKDEYYNVLLKDNRIKDGKAVFLVEQKKCPTHNYQIHFKVKAKETDICICNPDLFINIDTRDLANLDLGQPSGETEGQYDAGEAETYSSFLFWKGKETDRIQVDLSAAFNEQAKKNNATLNVSLDIPSEMKNKSKLYFNGDLFENSFVIKPSDENSILAIEIPHSIGEKEFVIGLRGIGSGLETINADEINTYISSIYLKHNVCWHPMKVLFMWVGIIVLGATIIWFVILRMIIYPRIRLSRLELSSKKGYYVNKKINGTRKVIVTNKHKPQGWLNKIFTGKILYIKDEIWTSPWELTPKGRKKATKISLHGKYMINPVTSELSNYGVYQLENLATKETVIIKIL